MPARLTLQIALVICVGGSLSAEGVFQALRCGAGFKRARGWTQGSASIDESVRRNLGCKSVQTWSSWSRTQVPREAGILICGYFPDAVPLSRRLEFDGVQLSPRRTDADDLCEGVKRLIAELDMNAVDAKSEKRRFRPTHISGSPEFVASMACSWGREKRPARIAIRARYERGRCHLVIAIDLRVSKRRSRELKAMLDSWDLPI